MLLAQDRISTAHRLVILALIGSMSGCASKQPAQLTHTSLLPDASDERAMWDEAATFDHRLQESGGLYENPALDDYLTKVANKVLTHLGTEGEGVRVRVGFNPLLNAFALPNGSVYIHSGLLVALNDEAELAYLLGHELAHYVHRHAIASDRNERGRTRVAAVGVGLFAFAAAVVTQSPDVFYSLADLGGAAIDPILDRQTPGYSRDQERDADLYGLRAIALAGYDPEAAIRLFETLRQEDDEGSVEDPYVLASHPHLEERTANAREFLAQWETPFGAEPQVGRPEFEAAIAPLLLPNVDLDLHFERFERAEQGARRYVAIRPKDGAGYLKLARILQSRPDAAEHQNEILAWLESAATASPDSSEVQRALGMMLRRLGRPSEAAVVFDRLLQIDPDAVDRAIIDSYIEEARQR